MTEVADLTIDELKAIIRQTVSEMAADPDLGAEIAPEFADGLRKAIESKKRGRGRPLEDFLSEIGEKA